MEISEFNPEKDFKNKTLYLMKDIIEAFYGEPQRIRYWQDLGVPVLFTGEDRMVRGMTPSG
ncbi:MAG: hypothetical protein M0R41_11570 [Methylobacter tundripaludum]|uniref:hypothetical protein n=1 Tax=Methylobacter tundripaludum TaxID=173365 RepID=UPI0015E4592D|nr:hypothetical protein [Methylobacter tundripaludum]MCK9636904.1 hypothetical protein [Methylobacter tundripaludum]